MKRLITSILVSLLVFLGTGLIMYPYVASWKNQFDQSFIIDNYESRIDSAEPERSVQIHHAHVYNSALSSGAIVGKYEHVPAGTGIVDKTSDGEDIIPYTDQLKAADNGLMSRIRIPSIDVDLPVYHGADDDTLLKGAGHLEGTSLPVGGKSTRTVITAHRGLASATMFTHLDQVKIGDRFTIETFGEVLTYEIKSKDVVEPEDSQKVLVEPDKDLATLITCTPLGINTHRILVTGERVEPTPIKDIESAGEKSSLPRFPWWAVIISVVIIGNAIYLYRATKEYKRYKSTLLEANEKTEEHSEQQTEHQPRGEHSDPLVPQSDPHSPESTPL
ncbi:class C sortase [Arcanobacterium phocae]|uniref:class C sortase n=1 Tax=Arcanobacterium phocae TaxID=131112 RepID=UPI001C0EA0F0|nr:class C sortase [Arcanobacterium phocae]